MSRNLSTSNSRGRASHRKKSQPSPKVVSSLLLLLIFVLVYSYIGSTFKQAADKNKTNPWDKSRFHDFYAMKKDSLDLLFIGSSHSYCTFDPEIIDQELNINSYQLGMPSQLPDASYYTLREALRSQSPKTVVMEVYWEILNLGFEMKQVDALFRVMKNNPLKWSMIAGFPLKEIFVYGLNTIHYQQDFFAYKNAEYKLKADNFMAKRTEAKEPADENMVGQASTAQPQTTEQQNADSVSSEQQSPLNQANNPSAIGQQPLKKPVAEEQTQEEYYKAKGYIYSNYVMTDKMIENIQANDYWNWEFNRRQKKYLDKIIALCKQKKIQLIFVTAPLANPVFEKVYNYELVDKKISAYAKDEGIPYLDFNLVNEKEKLFTIENFRDGGHLNHSGAEIACRYFAAWYKKLPL